MLDYADIKNEYGFNFENTKRNAMLIEKNVGDKKILEHRKTGTTLCGFVIKDAVILASDTRASAGEIVAEKNTNKFHYIAPNIYSCGAGTAADNDYVLKKFQYELELLRMNTGRQSRVKTLLTKMSDHLFRHMGQLGVYQIIGAFDCEGPQLYDISSSGYYHQKTRTTSGSGSLNAMSVLEHNHKFDMTIQEGIDLAIKSISAGILYDLGSGSNVNVIVLTKNGADIKRNLKSTGAKVHNNMKMPYIKNNIKILKSVTIKFDKEVLDNNKMLEE